MGKVSGNRVQSLCCDSPSSSSSYSPALHLFPCSTVGLLTAISAKFNALQPKKFRRHEGSPTGSEFNPPVYSTTCLLSSHPGHPGIHATEKGVPIGQDKDRWNLIFLGKGAHSHIRPGKVVCLRVMLW